MVYRAPVARFTMESPVGIAQLMGLSVFFPSAATFGSLASEVHGDWVSAPATPHPPVRPALPVSTPGLGWSWSSPTVESPVGIYVLFDLIFSA